MKQQQRAHIVVSDSSTLTRRGVQHRRPDASATWDDTMLTTSDLRYRPTSRLAEAGGICFGMLELLDLSI